MENETDLPDELKSVERQLRSLRPRSNVDRERLMFLAGQQAALPRPHSAWLWPTAAAAMTLVAACLAAVLLLPRQPLVIERVVYVNQPAPVAEENANVSELVAPESLASKPLAAPDIEPPSDAARPPRDASYLRVRKLALESGIDAWPMQLAAGEGEGDGNAQTYLQLTERLLPRDENRLGGGNNASSRFDWWTW